MPNRYERTNHLMAIGSAIRRYNSFRNSNRPSKRSAKSKANGTGQVLKHTRIVSETGLNTIFNVPEHQRKL